MNLPKLTEGLLLRRYKRFLADVELPSGEVVVAHCPNPGSMRSVAVPGWSAFLSKSDNPKRKLKWTLELIRSPKAWILVNTQRPNRIVEEAILGGIVAELRGYSELRREVKYGENSRIDLLLSEGSRRCYVEVKNVSLLMEDGQGAFPDSVTKRGAKHLRELAKQVEVGDRAVMFYLVSRTDIESLRPAIEIDPNYAREVQLALKAGVEMIAYRADVNDSEVLVTRRIPFIVD
jgi:sugar fermentation stimulation protein A